jgi:glutamate:GABA antiporter
MSRGDHRSSVVNPQTPTLTRALGRRDLIFLFVVAVFNLNVVPNIAANGGVTVWLWLISVLFFFLPQGVAVVELAHRYPGEGGVYLWAKEVFGDFHGFLSGWCYWTANMMYVPTLMLYFVGVSVYILGSGHEGLTDNKAFAAAASLLLLAFLVGLNIVGLGVGKWINNVGSIGTAIAAATLIGLGTLVWLRFGTNLTAADFRIPANPHFLLNTFGLTCFGLVGLELASVMGDEIKEPGSVLPGAVAWGGLISGLLYVTTTVVLLVSVSRKDINVLAGIIQAIGHMAKRLGAGWVGPPFALLLSLSIAGIASAWVAGCARIPFVAGLDSYLPRWLGKIHPRYHTPHVALAAQFVVSTILVLISFLGAGAQETLQRLLSLAVVIQMVPFLYMFAAVLKIAWGLGRGRSHAGGSTAESDKAPSAVATRGHYGKGILILAGTSGLLTTALGVAFAFSPAQQITSLLFYEAWMVGGTTFFVGLAVVFFYGYGRRKTLQVLAGPD